MYKTPTKKLAFAALFFALGIILPFFTGQIQAIGNKLLPMHIPVLLCGFVCGGPWGFLVGLLLPPIRYILFGMPPLFPVGIAMSLELATYGLVCGILYKRLPKKNWSVYVGLIIAMIAGRAVWGAATWILYGISGTALTWQIFIGSILLNAIPGIIIQLILIPVVIIALKKTGFFNE